MGRQRLQAPAFSGTSISLHRSLYFGVLIGKQPKVSLPQSYLSKEVHQQAGGSSSRARYQNPQKSREPPDGVAIGRVPPKEVSTQVATNYPFRGVLDKMAPTACT